MATISLRNYFELSDIADQIIDSRIGYEDIINFILLIDESIEDYDFSMDLLRRLSESLKVEGVKIKITEPKDD